MDYKFTFEDGSEALCHYGVLGMKWGVRKDRGKTEFNPSRGKGLDKRQQRLFDKSNAAYANARSEANNVIKKVNDKTYQREDLKKYERAAKKDIRAAERFAKSTGQLSKDAKANIRSRKVNKGFAVANGVLGAGGALGGTVALMINQPVAAIAIGGGAAIGTLLTSTIANKALATNLSTIDQYYNDISKANVNRKPIEARNSRFGSV